MPSLILLNTVRTSQISRIFAFSETLLLLLAHERQVVAECLAVERFFGDFFVLENTRQRTYCFSSGFNGCRSQKRQVLCLSTSRKCTTKHRGLKKSRGPRTERALLTRWDVPPHTLHRYQVSNIQVPWDGWAKADALTRQRGAIVVEKERRTRLKKILRCRVVGSVVVSGTW
jgi:hypothetical protein